jgi:hypothetical protein
MLGAKSKRQITKKPVTNYLIGEGMDFELINQDQTVADDLRTKVGVKRGIAQRVVGDVGHWAKKYKQDKTQDQAE